MAAATVNLFELLKDLPEGAWVAISEREHRVVSYSADIQTTLNMAKERGVEEPLIVRVPERSGMLFL